MMVMMTRGYLDLLKEARHLFLVPFD